MGVRKAPKGFIYEIGIYYPSQQNNKFVFGKAYINLSKEGHSRLLILNDKEQVINEIGGNFNYQITLVKDKGQK